MAQFCLKRDSDVSLAIVIELNFPVVLVCGIGGVTKMAINLSTLNGSNGFLLDGDAAGDLSGWWVSEAGDLNNDGIDDLVMGARKANGIGPNDSGTVYVVYGKTTPFPADFDVSSINGTNGFVIEGNQSGAQFGRSVASAGDFNNDGIDDIIVGSWLANVDGKSDNGAAYIIYGVDGGLPATFSLNSINGSNGFRIDGTSWKDWSGWSVAGAGDVNDDGIDDVVLGNWGENPGGREDAGSAQVIFGSSNPFGGAATVNQSGLTSTDGFKIEGANGKLNTGSLIDPGDGFGYAVSHAGDVNGDGIDDIIVGANRDNGAGDPFAGEYDYGAAYVIFGSTTGWPTNFKSSDIDGTNGFALPGYRTLDRGGYSVAEAGDVNNDGFDDIIIGNREIDTASEAGEAYIIYGSSTPFPASIDLQNLNGTNGSTFTGIGGGDFTGGSTNGAGDFNGDGIDDFIIGGQQSDVGGLADAGRAYLIFGQTGNFGASFDLGAITASTGVVFEGIAADDEAGRQVSKAGDLNGDGIDDIVIGAHQANGNGNADAGQSYVVFGSRYYGTAVQNFDLTISSNNGTTELYYVDAVDKVVAATASSGNSVGFTGAYGDGISYNPSGAGSSDLITITLENADGGQRTQTLTIGIQAVGSTTGNDTLTVTANMDVIDLLDGDDVYMGLGGDDSVSGNLGNDSIEAGDGNDTVEGGQGNDTLRGEDGNDLLLGDDGDDLINAGDGHDNIFGGDGNDTLNLAIGDDTASGGDGDDEINADLGDDLVAGDNGNDLIVGGGGSDTLYGDNGNDTINGGGSGPDLIYGGAGADSITSGISQDTIHGGAGDDTINAGVEADTIDGGTGNDVVDAGADNDNLFGGTGNDSLNGGDDDDTLDGWTGNDTLDGGAGIDTADYSGFGSALSVSMLITGSQFVSAAAGTDTILNVENLIGGLGGDTLTGTNGDNVIDGNIGNDFLYGQRGDDLVLGGAGFDQVRGNKGMDTLDGGAGRDVLIGGSEADTFQFSLLSDTQVGGFRDRIVDFTQAEDVIEISAFDAIVGGTDDAFTFIDTATFGTAGAGALRYFFQGAKTIVEGDVDGDNVRDFQIELIGNIALTAGDFVL